jgi:hypothetical protein
LVIINFSMCPSLGIFYLIVVPLASTSARLFGVTF